MQNTKLEKMTRKEEGQSVVEKPVLCRITWVVFPQRFRIRGTLGQIWWEKEMRSKEFGFGSAEVEVCVEGPGGSVHSQLNM